MAKTSDFAGKTVIVTGGASGIGLGLCRAFDEQGALVYAADINEQRLQEIAAQGRNITPLVLDVSSEDSFRQAIEQVVGDHGRLDILVNNAGIALAGDFNDTPPEQIERIVDINFWSVIHGTRLAYRQMIEQGDGHIVNVSSSGGAMPVPNQTMYSSIKHAVLGFSHSLREEAAHYGVRVSAVLPGMVQSDLWDTAVNVKDYDMKKNMEATGIKAISPAEAAQAILEGIAANDRSIVFPRLNRAVLTMYRLFPETMTRLAVAPLADPAKKD